MLNFLYEKKSVLLLVFGGHINAHIAAAQGVVQGLPHWRIYQSRVLGPFLTESIKKIFNVPFEHAYMATVFILLVIFFLALIFVVKHIWDSPIMIFAVVTAGWALNAILMQGIWLYLWDLVDLIIFTALIWAIITSRPLWVIASILMIEIFNREAAILAGLWLLSDAVFRLRESNGILSKLEFKIRYKQFFTALFLLIVGYTIIEFLRNTLLIREIGPEIFYNMKNGIEFFSVQLVNNLRVFKFSLLHPLYNLNMVFNVIILAIPIVAWRALKNHDTALNRVGFLYLILWIFTIVFGLIYETRVWLSFVPFLILVIPLLTKDFQCYLRKK